MAVLDRVQVVLGKSRSTAVEAVATAWGAQLRAAVKHWGPRPGAEDADLHWALELQAPRPWPESAFLGATVLEFGEHGIAQRQWGRARAAGPIARPGQVRGQSR